VRRHVGEEYEPAPHHIAVPRHAVHLTGRLGQPPPADAEPRDADLAVQVRDLIGSEGDSQVDGLSLACQADCIRHRHALVESPAVRPLSPRRRQLSHSPERIRINGRLALSAVSLALEAQRVLDGLRQRHGNVVVP